MTTDTPRTDACPYCGAERIPMPRFDDGRIQYYCGSGESWQSAGCRSTARIKGLEDEVERLKTMVKEAARLGDVRARNFKERAEKSETLIKQIHHYSGIIEGFQNPTDK